MPLATVEAVVARFPMHHAILPPKEAERLARESRQRTVEIQRIDRIGNREYDIVTGQIGRSNEAFHIHLRHRGAVPWA